MRNFTLVLRSVSHIFSSLWNVGWWREHIWNPLVSNVIQGRAISVHFYITTYILSGGISVCFRKWVHFTPLPLLALLLFILKGVKHLFLKLKANSLYESLENPEVDYYLKIWITISKSGLQSRNGGRPIPRKICRLLLWQVHWNVNQFTQERSKESYGKCILYNLRKVSGNPLKISENKWTNLTIFLWH